MYLMNKPRRKSSFEVASEKSSVKSLHLLGKIKIKCNKYY